MRMFRQSHRFTRRFVIWRKDSVTALPEKPTEIGDWPGGRKAKLQIQRTAARYAALASSDVVFIERIEVGEVGGESAAGEGD